MCEKELETEHIDPHSIGHNRVSFPFSWAAQPGAWGPASLGASFLYCILSPTRLIPNWLNFLCTELYNSSTSTFFLWASQFALIQPVHGQGYNPDIHRPDPPVIYTGAFPILTALPGRRSICNTFSFISVWWSPLLYVFVLFFFRSMHSNAFLIGHFYSFGCFFFFPFWLKTFSNSKFHFDVFTENFISFRFSAKISKSKGDLWQNCGLLCIFFVYNSVALLVYVVSTRWMIHKEEWVLHIFIQHQYPVLRETLKKTQNNNSQTINKTAYKE